MITYGKALDIIREAASGARFATETIDLSLVEGRVCARDVVSSLRIPSFDNSSMDGFAVRSDDFGKASLRLKIKTSVAAGDVIRGLEILPGECCEIMTGAPVPPGADSVIPVEQASREGEAVSFSVVPQPGDYIRSAGSDFSPGQIAVTQGTLLGLQHVLPLAALGVGQVEVYAKPKIAYIPTGREISDNPGRALDEGKIYNSSMPYALSFLSGADVLPQETVADDPAQFQRVIKKVLSENVDIVISSGAVSAGSHDFIRSSLEEMGSEILFHRAAIKPGKPILFARFPSGAFYFGLPGNPVSTAVGLRFFVQPFLAALTRQPPEQPTFARVKTALSRKPGLRLFLKTKISVTQNGVLEAELLEGQESYKTSPFLTMNGWIVVSEDRQSIDINDVIEIFPLRPFPRVVW